MIFFAVMTIVMTLLDFYVIHRWRKFCINKEIKPLYYKIPIAISILMLTLFIYSSYVNIMLFPTPDHVVWVNIATGIWYLPKILILPFLIISGLADKIIILIKKIKTSSIQNKNLQLSKSRRKFVGNFAWSLAGIPFIMAAKGFFHTVFDFKVYYERIVMPKLPETLNGLRLVQLSDLHFGKYINGEMLKDLNKKIEKLSPDIICITGDFVNFRYEELDYGHEFLKNLKAKYGVYACLGNHDHYMSDDDHLKLIKRIKSTGVDLMINEHKTLSVNNSYLNLISIDNFGSRQTYGDFEKAFSGVDNSFVNILLSHDPRTWESHVLNGYDADLTLSGHTHGGQVAIEFLGMELAPVKAVYKHYMGLYKQGWNYLYVNRGIGVSGPPIRLGINPEITLLVLEKPDLRV